MGEFVYFLAAMALTMVLMPPLIRLAGTAGFMDQPAPRKVHGVPMPRIGGLAITAGTFLPLLLWIPVGGFLASYFAAALLLVLAGTWDDHREIDFRVKFAAQLAAALVMVSADGVLLERFEFETTVLLPGAFAYLLTVTFLVGVTNAINFADGLDGLAGGTTLLCVVALSGLAWMSGDAISLALGLTLCGSILGFLRFNTHPARVFMGDGGSQLLGFTAGVLAVRITQQEDSVFAVTLPLLLLGLPLVDALSVIVQRLFEGRSPFAADRNHVHHKLLHAGFDHHQSVVLIYLVQFALFVIAWLVRFEADHVVIGIFFAFAAIFVALLQLVRQREWRWSGSIAGGGGGGSQLSRWVAWLKLPARLPLWSRLLLGALVAAYAAIVILRSHRIPPDLGILALVLLVPTTLLIPGRTGWLLVRMALFVATSLVVYLDETSAIAPLGSTLAYWLMFGAIALCTGISWRLAGLARFDITPLDWLVLFLAISLPVIASRWIGSGGLEAGIVKAVLLFYAIETLAQTGPSRSPWLRTAFGGLLAVMAARAILPFVTTMS